MIKKVFALVSVSALAGMAASLAQTGCSDSPDPLTPTDATDAGTATDARSERSNQPPAPGGDEPPCFAVDPITMEPAPLKPLRLDPGKCTKENSLDVLDALLTAAGDGGTLLFEEFRDGLEAQDAECAKCVFAEDGDTTPPITVDSSGTFTLHTSSCVEVLSSADCARAIVTASDCTKAACQKCSARDQRACSELVARPGSACGTYWSTLFDTCDTSLGPAQRTCGDTVSAIKTLISYQCIRGGTNGDAGTDGGDGGNGK